ncbi:MAG: hypothetical protein KBS80_08875 [Bacteroidales bacterium]|nr:hypothetical protein [Candidatus Cryptobacteroides choladohippi]
MKRFITFAAIAALAVVALSSCKKDGPDKKAQFGYATVTAKYSINDDLNKAADMTLNIVKFDGSKMSVPVSTTQQVVDIEKFTGSIPADFKYEFVAKQKESITKESFNCSLTYDFTVKVYDTTGKLKRTKSSNGTVSMNGGKEILDLIIERFNRVKTTISIKEDMTIE